MPTYSYSCEECNNEFELFFYIKDYTEQPLCSKCDSPKTHRRYINDVLSQSTSVKKSDSELKTLGDLANRNRDRLSSDEKAALEHKHNEYKDPKEELPLPKGMKRLKKQNKIKWT
jgi:putative FmdB family regulatory protein